MRIKKIQFKNIKSFGNKLEEISFSDSPELILLTGTNGVGKSTIQESIDLTIFGQIRGKNKKKIPLKHIPNRFNKNLHTNIEFFNFNNDSITIQRELLPTNFTISKNNEDITEQYSKYSKEEREKLLDFNYDTFKSFISLSMNDFLNFIELSTENKKLLLNKLFNLEKLDNYLSLTKELKIQNIKEIEHLKSKITNNNLNISEYKNLAITISKNNKTIQSDLKITIDLKKSQYINLQTKLKEINTNIYDNNESIEKINNSIRLLDGENIVRRTNLNNINSKIEIYEKGVCPHCESDLSKTKNGILDILLSDKKELMTLINNNLNIINNYKKQISELVNNDSIKTKRELTEGLNSLKEEIIYLSSEYKNSVNNKNNVTIVELKEKVQVIKKDNELINLKIIELNNKQEHYKKLIDLFDNNGIRKSIIKNLVKPINGYLNEFLKELNFGYLVSLNDEFNAEIKERNNNVYNEIISNGEMKIINILIALSYLKFLLQFKEINVLFLDEIFQSIHENNIDLLLSILKKISLDNKINIIVIHHGMNQVNLNHFDRILKLEKNFFSNLQDIKIK